MKKAIILLLALTFSMFASGATIYTLDGDDVAKSSFWTSQNLSVLSTALNASSQVIDYQRIGIPSMTGQGGRFLTTDGTTFVWLDLDANYQPYSGILTATTASFTTALLTKLNGIADGATAFDGAYSSLTGLPALGSLAALSAVTTNEIANGTVVNADISATAAIDLSKLAADPLARANHTGTQPYTTITGLGTLATQSGTFSGTSSGTNTGDQDLSGYALLAGTLAQFAPTTSSQLLGVISDESGTGSILTTNGSAAGLTSFPILNQSTTGNAATATALQTARTINGVSFDGTTSITVAAAAGTLTGNTLAAGVTASSLLSAAGGTFGTAAFTDTTAYEVPLTFSTGLTRTTNTITVSTSQNIATLSNLTSNGFVKTSGGTGALSVDTTSYQPLDAALTAMAAGSDFVQFTGPATATKVFTLPDASATILTDHTAVTVAQGGTGRTTGTTAYGLIAAGTTATGAQQTLAAGATTEILVGGGASALPVWTTATGSGAPVRAVSPSFTTPNIGVATATSINGTTIPTSKTLLVGDDIGSSVQAYDADLTTFASITPSANAQTLLGAANYAAMRTLLDLEPSVDYVAYSLAMASLQSKAGEPPGYVLYTTGIGGYNARDMSNVENTALSTWTGSTNLTTIGAVTATSINKVALTAPLTGSTLTIADGKTLTASNTITLTATDGSTLAIGSGGTLGTAAFTDAAAYEVPLTFSTGLTRTTNTITVNSSQNIATLSNLTSNGFVKTSGGTGALSVDTTSYLATTGDGSGLTGLSPYQLAQVSATNGQVLMWSTANSRWEAASPAGTGTVTSVGLSLPAIFTVSGSPVTSSGSLSATLVSQAANLVWAGPTTGIDASPTFRALVAADIPDLSGVYQPLSATLTTLSSATAAGLALMDDADAATQRSTLGLVIGTHVQAQSANLDDLADGSLTGSKVAAATTTSTGVVELATDGETGAGVVVQGNDGRLVDRYVYVVALSTQGADIATGTALGFLTPPTAITITGLRIFVRTSATGSAIEVDVKEAGVSILSTLLTIDAGETSSSTAAVPAVISDASIAAEAALTIDVTQVGAVTAGVDLFIEIQATKTP